MFVQILNFRALNLAPNNAHFSRRSSISRYSSIRCVSDHACNSITVNDVAGVLHNKVLVAAAVSAAIGQLAKPFTTTVLYGKKFDLMTAFQAGGFPSTHSSAAVATATSLALERGFADAIFGLAVVYAGLTMYDAQGVRREVGTHAKLLNKVLPRITSYSTSSRNDTNDLANSCSRESSPNFENIDPVLAEHTSFQKNPTKPSLLLKSTQSSASFVRSPGVVSDASGGCESVASPLKESIGHTEIEVAAGALLGFFVSLAICPYL